MYKARFAENRELTEASAATQVITHIEEAIEILEKQESDMSRKSVAHLREKLKELQDLFKSKQPAKAKKEPKEDETFEGEEETAESEEPEPKAEEMKEGNEFQMNPMGGDEEEETEFESEEEGPQDDDIAVEPTGPLGSRYSVGIVNGRHIGEFSNAEEVNEAIDEYKRVHNYFPTVWFIDDHGGHQVWNESTKVARYKPKFQA